MSSDTLFSTLPRATRNKIDSAFTSVAKKFLKPPEFSIGGGFVPESGGFIHDDQDDQQGGGFIHDEGGGGFVHDEYSGGGGFVPDEDNTIDSTTVSTQIPLSMIPSALQILDLPPDDDEVLSVFQNAATGWASSNDRADARRLEGDDEYVSRDDWRSVCAVLLEHDAGGDAASDEDIEMRGPDAESGASDSDEYHESESETEQNERIEDEEYVEDPLASTSRRRTRRAQKSSSVSPLSSSASSEIRVQKLTSRQRQTCIDAYTLFFPSISAEELLSQKIMIKDIQRVAKLLNEKLKAEEMVEMLETFSSSPDKSMSFDDFCRMMISAKLA